MEQSTPQEAGKAGAEDPSMEDILQSIKKIISEDDEDAAPADGKEAAKASDDEDVPGSDVLELTEVVQEDGTTESIKAEDAPKPAKETKPAEEAKPADVLSQIDEALGTESKPAAEASKPDEPKPAATESAPAAPVPSSSPSDPMLSDNAAAAATASFNKLKRDDELPPVVTTPSPEFKSGACVEDMVAAMLRPMIKEWLDTNLPAIVERIVDREVKRLTK